MQRVNNRIVNTYNQDEKGFINYEIDSTLSFAYREINENDRVLELGCATGYWGKYLKEHKNVQIVGLDFLEYHVKEAQKRNCYEDVITYDLNHLDDSLEYLYESFDEIVILDVLEHLYNPSAVLDWCKSLLKPDGKIIISIPNVSNKSVIYQLLQNEFHYTEYGLLDRTHIRFFTLNSFIDVLTENNLQIKDIKRIISYEVNDADKLPEYFKKLLEVNSEIETYQYVFIVGKVSNIDIQKQNSFRYQIDSYGERLRTILYDVLKNAVHKYSKKIFSVTNEYSKNKKHKVITILGIKIKLKV